MFECIKPSCMKNGDNTTIKIKSSCFDKPIEIHFSNDNLEHQEVLEEIVSKILERKKTIQKRKSEDLENLKTLENLV